MDKEVIYMAQADNVLKFAYRHNGIVTSAQVTREGISRQYLKNLLEKGLLEKSERGIYILPDNFDDEMFNLQYRYSRGIFSHETALFLHDLTDRTPVSYSMTFPLNYNTSGLKKENVRYYRVKLELYNPGIITEKTPGGNEVKVYSAERTLCDILKGRSKTDIQVISEAFRRYVQRDSIDIPLLSEYAKLLKVDKKLRAYLEVLL